MVVNRLIVHPLSNLWFQMSTCTPYIKETVRGQIDERRAMEVRLTAKVGALERGRFLTPKEDEFVRAGAASSVTVSRAKSKFKAVARLAGMAGAAKGMGGGGGGKGPGGILSLFKMPPAPDSPDKGKAASIPEDVPEAAEADVGSTG